MTLSGALEAKKKDDADYLARLSAVKIAGKMLGLHDKQPVDQRRASMTLWASQPPVEVLRWIVENGRRPTVEEYKQIMEADASKGEPISTEG